MYKWASDLFPINRSLTGAGVRESLAYIKKLLPELTVHAVPTGYQAFDWEVPEEWVINEAYIENQPGERIVDFKNNNLHVVGYSSAVDAIMSRSELDTHLHSLPDKPDAIPYVTAYYKRKWGFCLTHKQRSALPEGNYHVVIQSQHIRGFMNYGEIVIPGESSQEVLFSTYICHPSMANNELSGPVVCAALAKYIGSLPKRKYTYRFVFVPETLGSIVFISKNIEHLKKWVVAGYNVSCVGDNRAYSYLPSRHGDTISDRAALHVLKHTDPEFDRYTWLERGSDERQYCSPGVDLPIASIMRTKYGKFPEYHTSLDNLSLISPDGLQGAFDVYCKAIEIIENNCVPKTKIMCEPRFSKHGLYSEKNTKGAVFGSPERNIMNMFSYCDGTKSLLDIANLIQVPFHNLLPVLRQSIELDLLEIQDQL